MKAIEQFSVGTLFYIEGSTLRQYANSGEFSNVSAMPMILEAGLVSSF